MRSVFFVSTCGTSLITRGIESHERSRFATVAHRSESEIDSLEKSFLEEILGRAEKKLFEAAQREACAMSAELSGLAAWRSSHPGEGYFEQVLLHSSTFVGRRCAEIIARWCNEQGWNSRCKAMADLNVTDPLVFNSAATNLFHYFHEEVTPHREAKSSVVLNLTGGYKAMQGLLQTAGTLYADEMFYLFEGSSEILSLPQLPLKIDDAMSAHVLEHESLMWRLLEDAMPIEECSDVTPLLLDVIDGQAFLSPLGVLIAEKALALSEKERADLRKDFGSTTPVKKEQDEPATILSSCGSSVLTNALRDDKEGLSRLHRITTQKHVSADDQIWLDSVAQNVEEQLMDLPLQEVRRMSAELNGLIALYEEDPRGLEHARKNYHVLVCSDTEIGKRAAQLVQSWCKQQKWPSEVTPIEDLTAASAEKFLFGASRLVELCRNLRSSNKGKILYNLVGGWKALQGFLQTLGAFYADDVVYLHEDSQHLLHMVPLPVRLEEGIVKDIAVEKHLVALRRLQAGCELRAEDHQALDTPSMALLTTGQGTERRFTPWGELMFEEAKKAIYRQRLWPSPDDRIVFDKNFQKSFETESILRESHWLYQVNFRIDSLLRYVTSKGVENPTSLNLKRWQGNSYPPSNWEMRAWSGSSGWRILLHQDEGRWILDWIIPHSK